MRGFSDKHVKKEGKKRGLLPALIGAAILWNVALTACAQGEPYVATVAALKADAPGQKMIVATQGYTFEKTMAELAAMEVVVQDSEDGSRLCHIPDTSLLDTFAEEINVALTGVPIGEDSFYYYDAATGSFQTYAGTSCYQINEAGKELLCYTFLQMLAEGGAEDRTVDLGEDYVDLVTVEVPEEIAVNKYSVEGSCTTSFKGSSANRIKNIQIASSNINQLVVGPGEEVSMNKAFLPRTSANGYRSAGTYSGGKVVSGIGGGICQVSSTVYNAAINGGMTILERHPHSMPVHYLPLGMDAAISSGSKDLRFRNDYPFPVLLEAYTSGNNLTVNVYTNDLMTAGTSYRLHAVRKGSLAASAYLEVCVDGVVVEDRPLGMSRYSPMKTGSEEED